MKILNVTLLHNLGHYSDLPFLIRVYITEAVVLVVKVRLTLVPHFITGGPQKCVAIPKKGSAASLLSSTAMSF